jgi:tetratricopeptide (TPR) repeat protein
MRPLLTFFLLLFIASSVKADTTAVFSKDTVYARYMTRGAWQQPLFSKKRLDLTDSALKYLPKDAYLWQQRSMPLIKQMKYELSLQYMDSAVKYNPSKYVGHRGFLKCIFQKDYKGALVDLLKSKAERPNANEMDHPWDFWIGLCHLQLSQYDKAEAAFQDCVDHDYQVSSSWGHHLHPFYLGIAQLERKKFVEAQANFDLTLQRHKIFADAKYYKALCLHASSQVVQAMDLLVQAQRDLAAGNTFNEDSSPYEKYPYQITKWMVDGMLVSLKPR